ncbi:MAG: hypothetical protein KDN20_09190 [Verrucomicrobiae bacterium]|nr:hypothetical protein [Verrucomicrobiae bacterium]
MSFSADKAFELIVQAREQGRLAHAYLIAGPIGSGKHVLAERIIRMVNGLPSEITGLESLRGGTTTLVRPESKSRTISIDAIRAAEHTLHMSSERGVTKFAIIDDCDRMGQAAENAFLKTLEEPPRASMLLLLTSQPEQLLDTILSRCIRINLMGMPGGVPLTDAARQLLDALAAHFKAGTEGISGALGLMATFSGVLKQEKAEFAKRHDEALKAESAHYKKVTEGDWLKRREEYYKGLTESEYLQTRSQLIEYLVAWFGDALRQQVGGAQLDLPEYAAVTAAVAQRFEGRELDRKIEMVEKLRSHFATNVQEALAMEVAFIRAFA